MRLQQRSIPTVNPFDRAAVGSPMHARRMRAAAPRSHAAGSEPTPARAPALHPPQAPGGSAQAPLAPPQHVPPADHPGQAALFPPAQGAPEGSPAPVPLAPPAHATDVEGALSEEVGQAALQVILRRGAPNLSRDQLRRALPVVLDSVEGVDLPELRAAVIGTWDALHADDRPVHERAKYTRLFADRAARYLCLLLRTPEGAARNAEQPLWQPWLAGCSPARLREVLAEAAATQREQSTHL